MATCADKQVADNPTFWACSFHGSFCSRRSMLLGRRVRASCRVTLCIGLLPRKLDAGPAGPFSWCHGNQLALRPRRRGASWSAHATTAVANISNKKSKACNGNRNKPRSHVLTIQSNIFSTYTTPIMMQCYLPLLSNVCWWGREFTSSKNGSQQKFPHRPWQEVLGEAPGPPLGEQRRLPLRTPASVVGTAASAKLPGTSEVTLRKD